jgi:hypothetical protein
MLTVTTGLSKTGQQHFNEEIFNLLARILRYNQRRE